MRIGKKCLFLLFFFSPLLLTSQVAAFLDLQTHNKKIKIETEVISEIFRSEIIKKGFVTVLETSQKDKIKQEALFQKNGFTTDTMIEIGKEQKCSFLGYGLTQKYRGKFYISYQILSIITGEIIFAEDLFCDKNELIENACELAMKVHASILKNLIGYPLHNAYKAYKNKDYAEALVRIDNFENSIGSTDESQNLKKDIRYKLGLLRIKKSKLAYKAGESQKAFEMSIEALLLMETDEISVKHYTSILVGMQKTSIHTQKQLLKQLLKLTSYYHILDLKKLLDNIYDISLLSGVEFDLTYFNKKLIRFKVDNILSRSSDVKRRVLATPLGKRDILNNLYLLKKCKDLLGEAIAISPDHLILKNEIANISKMILKNQKKYLSLDKSGYRHISALKCNNPWMVGATFLLNGTMLDSPREEHSLRMGFGAEFGFKYRVFDHFLILVLADAEFFADLTSPVFNNDPFFGGSVQFAVQPGYGGSFADIFIGPVFSIGGYDGSDELGKIRSFYVGVGPQVSLVFPISDHFYTSFHYRYVPAWHPGDNWQHLQDFRISLGWR